MTVMIQLTNSQGAAPIYVAPDAINALLANPLDKSTIILMAPRAIEVVESIDVVLAKLAALETPTPTLSQSEPEPVGLPVTGTSAFDGPLPSALEPAPGTADPSPPPVGE